MKYIWILVVLLLSTAATARSACDSEIAREMERCAKSNYEEADTALNREYINLIKSLPNSDKFKLQEVQRYWVTYKTRYCKDTFSAKSPGNEAGIEMWSCLESATDSSSIRGF
ncbi:lysozyme inhibitor LprI family protein [Paraburkholderia diazotrophica]|uniref:lysozyme inhibitor LprI family protein n=1 Tax=Paraburkholderia diazotrophica TaxID=667676 RepID=UPI000B834B84